MEEAEIRELTLFAEERNQRAPAGHGQLVEANRVGPVAATGRLADGDWKRGALEWSENSDRAWDHG